MAPPNKEELTFYLNVYQDADELEICLKQLRQVYRNSRLVIRSDGDPDPKIDSIAKAYGGDCHYGERLMGIEKGGLIVHEMLRLFLTDPTPYLLKIDPDTRIFRPFKALPKFSCVFGTAQRQGELFSIQGGCLGMTLEVAKRWYAADFFLDPAFAERPPPWVITPLLRNRPIDLGLTSIDWLVGWACKNLATQLVDWPEILSEWKVTPENEDLRYAVTHPHKPRDISTKDSDRCALRYWEGVSSITGHSLLSEDVV